LPVTVRRDGKLVTKTIRVSGDWKKADIAWRASSWYGLRHGVKLEPLPAAEKAARGIDADRLALAVKGLYGRGGPKVKAAGLQANDIVVAVNDRTEAMTETDFLAYLRLQHGPSDSLRLKVLRGDSTRELTVPLW
jgi:S1-C subfamily serine protease